jgi:hypothetical protein
VEDNPPVETSQVKVVMKVTMSMVRQGAWRNSGSLRSSYGQLIITGGSVRNQEKIETERCL